MKAVVSGMALHPWEIILGTAHSYKYIICMHYSFCESFFFIQVSSSIGVLFACGWILQSSAMSVIINIKVKTFRESMLDLEKSRLM